MQSSKPPIDGRRRSNATLGPSVEEAQDLYRARHHRTGNSDETERPEQYGDMDRTPRNVEDSGRQRRTTEDYVEMDRTSRREVENAGRQGRTTEQYGQMDRTPRNTEEGGRQQKKVEEYAEMDRTPRRDFEDAGRHRRRAEDYGGSLRRNEELGSPREIFITGSLRREVQRPGFVGTVGSAGSEMNINTREMNINTRAGSEMNINSRPGHEMLTTRAGSELNLKARSDLNINTRARSEMHINTDTNDERAPQDHYCSSCEEDDLNESLMTTTTTNSSDLTATCSSGSNSIAQECWENDIAPDGSLLYISCYYSNPNYDGSEILNRIQRQQQTQGPETERSENRIIKLIRKKSLKKSSSAKTKKLNIEIPSATVKKLKSYIPCGDPRDVSYQMSQNMNLGRRATLSEIKLGLQLDEAGDQLRVVDIIPDSSAYNSKLVQMNDILLCVNDRPVSKHNINEILSTVLHPGVGQVRLKVQATKSKHELARDKHQYKSKLVMEILNGIDSTDRTDMCLVYVNGNGIQYKYPAENNNLINSFGLFLTLNNLFNNAPVYSSTRSVECDSHVVFTRDKQYKNSTSPNLLLVGFPQQQFSTYELCLKMNKLIVRCVKFLHGYDLDSVFTQNSASLNRLFSFLFNRLLVTQGDFGADKVSNEEYIKLCNPGPGEPDGRSENTRSVVNDEEATTEPRVPDAENENKSDAFTFPLPRKLALNAELDAQINDALGELEANDTYEDDVKNFITIGTILYYKQYLVTSHANQKDLESVHSALFCHGLLHLNGRERNIKNVILWKRVHPKTHLIDNLYYNNSLKAENTYYLLVYGRSNFLLCTLLESNYFTNPQLNPVVQPDVKLIKHAEEIVNFLISTRNISYLNKEIHRLRVNSSENQIEIRSSDWMESLSLSGSYPSHSTLTDEDYDFRKPGEVSTALPVRLLANSILFYYAHVNRQDGVLFSPERKRSSPHDNLVFAKFQTIVYKMEKVFRNYAKFKKLNSALHSKPVKLNRTLICVKESGVCFQVGDGKYWAIGRLYNNVNQVYVCYEDRNESVLSQNMIEIMFKLFLSYS
ncbi:hypothetical protein M8J76_009551 [Diaphorina citri]|nr:hypothetical protein M8J75_012116 [Diaphorina citri]KAI5716622.1 hypothetical protein M8J76_009551 [Diaphorina citri]